MQKKVSIDPVTGEVIGKCDIHGFYMNIERLLDIYKPDDIDFDFHVGYPAATKSTDVKGSFIIAFIESETPSKRDTSYRRSSAPRTRLPVEGIVLPKAMPEIDDGSKTDLKRVYYQPYDAVIRFEVYSKFWREGQRLSYWFRQFMRETRQMHLVRGVNNVIFLEYKEESDLSFRFRESYRQGQLRYFVQYQDVWSIRVPRLRSISVGSSVANKFYMNEELPLELVKHDHKFTISEPYNGLSRKVPEQQ